MCVRGGVVGEEGAYWRRACVGDMLGCMRVREGRVLV